ncbi:MAG: hypothetical protein ACR2G0_10450 [Chthoniobacterales bacterium]
MKLSQRLVLIATVFLLLPSLQTLAESPVTFEIVASFDYPGAIYTYVTGVNNRGDVSGAYQVLSGASAGFIRYADGSYSAPIMHPKAFATVLTGINNTGTVSGFYTTSANGNAHGFLYSNSAFEDISTGPVNGVNDAGNFCGLSGRQGYVSIDGVITTFNVGGSTYTYAIGINDLNQTAGFTITLADVFGFRRDVDGTTLWPIRPAEFTDIYLYGIDDHGRMVGEALESDGVLIHGFLFYSSHQFAVFDYPGSTGFTTFNGLNDRGLICGNYNDNSGNGHAFIVRAKLPSSR